ncbi:hypothetical protein MAM1_0079c04477 [Mucor ambiguus]|uniref:Uncharacterized protein n=1 Tax=Mucor ambiguus TaxID=91626 RepID=A0A0C9MCB3_9FUNG|nr:hypothetical protein MAM1_0079c04477 [Mucor ambiguus]
MLSLGASCCCDRRLLAVLAMLSPGNLVLAAAVYCRSFAVLVLSTTAVAAVHLLCIVGDDIHYSFGWLVLFAAAVAVYLLSWCGLGPCFCCLLSFICCLGAVYCYCCCSFIIAVLAMHSLGKLVQFTAAVAVYLLSWRLLGALFCCCCRSFAVLVMLYRINLVLSAAASIYWLFW